MVTKLSCLVSVSLVQNLYQSSFKRLNESGRLHMNLLRLFHFFSQVLDLHNVVLRHKGINFLSFFIDESGVLELGA